MTAESLAELLRAFRMWPGDPSRLWSRVRDRGCRIPHAGGEFGGSRVCDGYLVPVVAVCRVLTLLQDRDSWLCAAFKKVAGVL